MAKTNSGGTAPAFNQKGENMNCEIKYAPKCLNDIIYPSIGVERRIKAYAANEVQGHIILHGPNGTGKTTLANLLVKQIGNQKPFIELKDIDELLLKPNFKQYLQQSATFATMTESEKYFLVLNEFDYSKKNLNKFWTSLDSCGDRVMAVITTNQPMDIHPSIRSRCDLVEMPGIFANEALPRIQYCLNLEGVNLPDKQILHYLKLQEQFRDLRKYFRVADQIIYLSRNNMTMPSWNNTPTSIRVV